MAFKLTKSDKDRRYELLEQLRKDMITIQEHKDGIATTTLTLEEANLLLVSLHTTLEDIEEFRDEVATRLREEYDEKSERWQESDRAAQIDEFIGEWENEDFSPGDLEILQASDTDSDPAAERDIASDLYDGADGMVVDIEERLENLPEEAEL